MDRLVFVLIENSPLDGFGKIKVAFKEKSSLTEEEKTELVSLLTVNGVPIHNQPFMNHVKENPSKIGSGISSVFVNSNGDLVRFTKLGKPSKAKTSLISVGWCA